jgi:hypothetical protein
VELMGCDNGGLELEFELVRGAWGAGKQEYYGSPERYWYTVLCTLRLQSDVLGLYLGLMADIFMETHR